MKRIQPLKIKLRQPDNTGIFHDTRSDVRELAKALNMVIEKQNEIILAVNRLMSEKQER